jgi:uncharacterized protein YdaT
MPWNSRDVSKHYKGASGHEKRIWVAVANAQLSRGEDEGTAIKSANAQVDKYKAKH